MERDARDYRPYIVKWISDENEVENWLVDGTMWETMVEMAEKKREDRTLEIWTRWTGANKQNEPEPELLYSRLSSSRQRELDSIMGDITKEAKEMIEDYTKHPTTLAGEVDVDKGLVKGSGIEVDLDVWDDKDSDEEV